MRLCYPLKFQIRQIESDPMDYRALESRFANSLSLGRRPVAVSFLDAVPEGLHRLNGTQPSGCSFWRLAADGRSFYTLPEDHFNCAVGAYTHNINLSAEREAETGATLKMMFDLGYVKPEEVPNIPRLPKSPAAIVYSPLGDAAVAPDVVVFTCKAKSAMLLNEAAGRAGVSSGMPALGRPTCMALPASMAHGGISSLGCMGNRVYTGLNDDEMYFVARGKDLTALADALEVIVNANAALLNYAGERRRTLATT
jgi:uncharacterized protein (DUF169 family)